MEKKLPKIFANKSEKVFNNNERVFYSRDRTKDNTSERHLNKLAKPQTEDKNIYQKINDIFNSEKYVYKADVEIKTNNGKIKTKVIGQNRTHLITIDNELIPIFEIKDIYYIN